MHISRYGQVVFFNKTYWFVFLICLAYERGHQRPPLTVYTFQGPSGESESQTTSPSSNPATPKADAGIQGCIA